MSDIVDRAKANDLLAKCKAALAEVLTAEGFELTKTSAKYGDSFSFSMSAIPKATNELGLNPNDPAVVDFNRYHTLFNLDPKALGVKFTVGAKSYTFEGLQMSRRKYPLAVSQDGKKVLLTDDPRVISAINAATQALAASADPVAPTSPSTPVVDTPKEPRTPRKM